MKHNFEYRHLCACILRTWFGLTEQEIAVRVGIIPKGVSKALKAQVGKAERRNLAAKHEDALQCLSTGRLLDQLETVEVK